MEGNAGLQPSGEAPIAGSTEGGKTRRRRRGTSRGYWTDGKSGSQPIATTSAPSSKPRQRHAQPWRSTRLAQTIQPPSLNSSTTPQKE